ncbi:hypothetical protein AX17_005644 [Amanita inopinata Kibby_2008]|nr:hypothetical protein AX17_005644 [Amanita inopinata Kibby_2008]
MAEKYRSICFARYDRKAKRLCDNLSNPLVKNMVREVEIRPWQIEKTEAVAQPQSFFGSARKVFTLWTNRKQTPLCNTVEEELARRKNAKMIKRVLKTVGELPNVQECKIFCDSGRCHSSFTREMVPSLINWRHSLTKLSFCVPPEMLGSLASVSLDRLESLELIFWTDLALNGDARFLVLNPLTVFVNNLFPTLRSLSILTTRAAQSLDLTQLFSHLETFPLLRHFALSMPCDGSSLSSMRPVLLFIGRHKALQSIQLSTSNCAPRVAPVSSEVKEWIPKILNFVDDSFYDIQQANIALRPLRAQTTLDALAAFLSNHGHNLTSLALTEDNTHEIHEIFNAQMPRSFIQIRYLSIDVRSLSAKQFMSLYKLFPNLKELQMGFMYFPQRRDFDDFGGHMIDSREYFRDWGLNHVAMLYRSGQKQEWREEDMRFVLQTSIPSLETFELASVPLRGRAEALAYGPGF